MSRERRTPKQDLVLATIHGRTDHPTVEDLYHTLRAQGHRISLATVYRALHVLAQRGELSELVGEYPARFDPVTAPHMHFRCRSCGRIFDFPTSLPSSWASFASAQGFKVESHNLTVSGLCSDCQERKEVHHG